MIRVHCGSHFFLVLRFVLALVFVLEFPLAVFFVACRTAFAEPILVTLLALLLIAVLVLHGLRLAGPF